MKKLVSLVRQQSTPQGTPGLLTFGTENLRTLELPWRDNLKQKSCIPIGSYRAIWAKSPRMGMCYHLVDVPQRSSVLIHSANFAGNEDEGWVTQLQGCIAPCSRIGYMNNGHGKMQLAGLVSRPALEKLNLWGNKEDIFLEIIDGESNG